MRSDGRTKAEKMRELAVAHSPATTEVDGEGLYGGILKIIDLYAKDGKCSCRVDLVVVEQHSPGMDGIAERVGLLSSSMITKLERDGFSACLKVEVDGRRFYYWLSIAW